MKNFLFITLFISLFLSAKSSFAEIAVWNLDKAHSNFYFSIKHIFSQVNGHFDDFSGTIKFAPDNLAESKFIFEVKVSSINTYNGKRDKHLLSKDFFSASDFPLIRFESSEITAAGNNIFNVKGTFNIKGKDYDLGFPLTFAGVKDHPMMENNLVAGFNGTLTIDRLKHNVGTGKFYEAGVVGKDVDIFISLEVLNKK